MKREYIEIFLFVFLIGLIIYIYIKESATTAEQTEILKQIRDKK